MKGRGDEPKLSVLGRASILTVTSLRHLTQLADALGVSLAALFEGL